MDTVTSLGDLVAVIIKQTVYWHWHYCNMNINGSCILNCLFKSMCKMTQDMEISMPPLEGSETLVK